MIYAEFDFLTYWVLRLLEAIKTKNLDYWTTQRLKSLLYWQNSVKKLLKSKIEQLIKFSQNNLFIAGCGSEMKIKGYKYNVYSMEAMDINVFSTMKLNGIKLAIKPEFKIYLVCLLCSEEKINLTKPKRKTLDQFI